MSEFFAITAAAAARIIFAIHGIAAIWRVALVYKQNKYWFQAITYEIKKQFVLFSVCIKIILSILALDFLVSQQNSLLHYMLIMAMNGNCNER